MSNSFASPPPLADPQSVVAGQPISFGAINSIGQTLNYSFGVGGISNVISQAWANGTCSQSLTTYQEMCEWKLPAASTLHLDLEVYLLVHGTGSNRLTLDSGGVSDVQEVATSGASESLYISTLSLASIGATFCTLTLEAKATSGTLRIASIMARWAPLTSPLPTEQGSVVGQVFTPMGADRLGDQQALSARVGHRMIDNINTLRHRFRTWVSWSGVSNADIYSPAYGYAEWLGAGDMLRLLAPTSIPWAEVSYFTIWAALRVQNYSVDTDYELLGQRITVTADGWSFYALNIVIEPEESTFKLPLYRVGLDATPLNLIESKGGFGSNPDITALCMWGA